MSGSLSRSHTPDDIKKQKRKDKGLPPDAAAKFTSAVKSKIDISDQAAAARAAKQDASPTKSISYTASSKLLQSTNLLQQSVNASAAQRSAMSKNKRMSVNKSVSNFKTTAAVRGTATSQKKQMRTSLTRSNLLSPG